MIKDDKPTVSDKILYFLFQFPVIMSLILLLWWGTFWIAKTMMQWLKEF